MFKILVIAAIVAPCAVAAQSPARGATKVGDVHVYVGQNRTEKSSYEETVTVTEIVGNMYKTKHARSDRPEVSDGAYNKEWGAALSGTSGTKFDPPTKLLEFPIEPGKQWKHNYKMMFQTGGTGTMDMESKVVGFEKIKTPAGEFDAVRIDSKGYLSLGQGRGFYLTQGAWYAPSIDRVVRLETKEQRTMGADTLVELKSFKPAQ